MKQNVYRKENYNEICRNYRIIENGRKLMKQFILID